MWRPQTKIVVVLAGLLFPVGPRGFGQPITFTRLTSGPVATDTGNAHGCAWVDFDGDGLQDLFDANYDIVTRFPCFLYRNLGKGTFTKITNGTVVSRIGTTTTGVWGDYDNDGLPDLFLPDYNSHNFLFHNQGKGTFTEVTGAGLLVTETNLNSWNAAWGDYDNDGWLDLIVTSAAPSGKNRLYHNNGNGAFTKITEGALVNEPSFASGCAWADYDNDGFLDLFIAQPMRGQNSLYHNNCNGTFTKVQDSPVATDRSRADGCAWGDYDNDGFLDLFVPNQNRASSLYHNNRDGTFSRILNGALDANVSESLAAVWGDYDNDGFLDLFVANGRFFDATNFLYHNNGDGTFTRVTEGRPVNDVGIWHGAIWGDYDNDGFLDLFVSNWGGPGYPPRENALYHNNGNSNSWVEIKCVGTISNRDGVGAKVRVKASYRGASRWQMREIQAGSGVVQNSIIAHFGLGEAVKIEEIRVEWPSRAVQVLNNLPARQLLTLKEPAL